MVCLQRPTTWPTARRNTTPYPLTFPPLNATASHPNPIVIFNGIYNPQSGMTAPIPWDTYPYTENYFLSIRAATAGADRFESELRRVRRLIICPSCIPLIRVIRLSVWPSISLAFLRRENLAVRAVKTTTYNLAEPFTFGGITYPAGTALQGTRQGLEPEPHQQQRVPGNYFGNDDYQGTIGNANYNALQVSLKSRTKRLTYSLGYTYSKSIDQASSLCRCRRSLQFQPHARPFGLESDARLCGDLRLPIAAGTAHVTTLAVCWRAGKFPASPASPLASRSL